MPGHCGTRGVRALEKEEGVHQVAQAVFILLDNFLDELLVLLELLDSETIEVVLAADIVQLELDLSELPEASDVEPLLLWLLVEEVGYVDLAVSH